MAKKKRGFIAHPIHMDRKISMGINQKADRRKLVGEARLAYLEEWFAKYGEAKRRKLDILFEEQDGKCCFCDKVMWRYHQTGLGFPANDRATLEHIRCKADGGTDNLRNLALSCLRCNNRRGKIDFDKFMKHSQTDGFKTLDEKRRARKEAKLEEKLEKAKPRHDRVAFFIAVLWLYLIHIGHPSVDILEAYVNPV